jgi:hypothetical protein
MCVLEMHDEEEQGASLSSSERLLRSMSEPRRGRVVVGGGAHLPPLHALFSVIATMATSTVSLGSVRPVAVTRRRVSPASRALVVRTRAASTIVETAAAAGSFKTLLAAATAAGLVETLNGSGPLTVFAPTDAAFAALPAGTVENLLKPENKEELVAILTCVSRLDSICGAWSLSPPGSERRLLQPVAARSRATLQLPRREGEEPEPPR